MTRITSILLTVTLLAAVSAGGLGARAQNPKADPKNGAQARKESAARLHPQARIGSTPERKAAWERLTPAERRGAEERFKQIFEGAAEKARKERGAGADETTDATAVVSDGDGNRRTVKAKAGRKSGSLKPAAGAQAGDLSAPARDRGVAFVKASARTTARPALAARPAPPAPQSGCWKNIEPFVRDFYLGGLARQPSPYELNYWVSRLTYSQAQGMEQLWVDGRELGSAVFRSAEYAARGRSDVDFVHDLYQGYLQRGPDQNGWDAWVNALQTNSRDVVIDGFAFSTEFWVLKIQGLCNAASADSDGDTLPDLFETRVADGFTPAYHVSAGDPDHFSTFLDQENQVVAQRFGQNAISHYRVVPQGFTHETGTGQMVSVLRVDYLTLLDHDSGLVNGFFCQGIGSFGIPLGGTGAHPIDNERAAVLLAAPVSDYSYNLDPSAYRAYTYLAVAHEDVPVVEQRTYLSFSPPLPYNAHIHLWLSLSKHGTYFDDPDYLPLIPWYIRWSVYDEIDWLYYNYYISDYEYFSLLFQADTLFYTCIVERFHEQGWQYAFLRINVGEPDAHMNGARFINAGALEQKLLKPFFF